MIDTILFDVDSTLIDTEQVTIKSLKMTLKKLKNIEVQDDHELYFILGITGEKAIRKFAKNESDKKILLKDWSQNIELLKSQEKVFPDIIFMLRKLKELGFTTGVVTSKTQYEMNSEFNHFGINSYFDCFVNASDTKRHKPNAEPIRLALKRLNKLPSTAMYVGDSPYDFETAKNSKVAFAWAKWGSRAKEQDFANADISLKKPRDLIDYLTSK